MFLKQLEKKFWKASSDVKGNRSVFKTFFNIERLVDTATLIPGMRLLAKVVDEPHPPDHGIGRFSDILSVFGA